MRAPVSSRGWQAALVAAILTLLAASAWRASAISPAPIPDPSAPPAAKAHPSSADVKSELSAVIDAQLAAFRADDYAKAYTFAASGIKDMVTATDFEGMVRKGYPVIAHSTDVDYGMAFDTGEDAVIYVRVQDTARKIDAQYQYLLKKENGAWKIGGVAEVKPSGLSV